LNLKNEKLVSSLCLQIFNLCRYDWAIENSDPEKLREMAEASKANGGGGGLDAVAAAAAAADASAAAGSSGSSSGSSTSAGSLPDAEAASKVQPGQRWTEEEVLEKRESVKELLDLLAMNPTEQSYIKLATDMYLNKTLTLADRLMALEEMEDLIGPVDNANDLHVLGALAPLVATTVDTEEDDEIGAAAAGVLATAMSNNPKVQALVHAWRPPTPENIAAAAAAAAGGGGEDGSSDNEGKRRLTQVANAKGLHGVIDVLSPVPAKESVEAKLSAIARDSNMSTARRSKSLFALSAGLYTLNPVYPYLESTWFRQPLNLSGKKLVSKIRFQIQLVALRPGDDPQHVRVPPRVLRRRGGAVYKLTGSLKAPGFNP
jgi:hypothetical protein